MRFFWCSSWYQSSIFLEFWLLLSRVAPYGSPQLFDIYCCQNVMLYHLELLPLLLLPFLSFGYFWDKSQLTYSSLRRNVWNESKIKFTAMAKNQYFNTSKNHSSYKCMLSMWKYFSYGLIKIFIKLIPQALSLFVFSVLYTFALLSALQICFPY